MLEEFREATCWGETNVLGRSIRWAPFSIASSFRTSLFPYVLSSRGLACRSRSPEPGRLWEGWDLSLPTRGEEAGPAPCPAQHQRVGEPHESQSAWAAMTKCHRLGG